MLTTCERGHPRMRNRRCTYCHEPLLPARPLRERLQRYAERHNVERLSHHIADRFECDQAAVLSELRRILSGQRRRVKYWWAERYAFALDLMPFDVWGPEWEACSLLGLSEDLDEELRLASD